MRGPFTTAGQAGQGREGSLSPGDEGYGAGAGGRKWSRHWGNKGKRGGRDAEKRGGLVELRWSLAGAGLGKGCRLRGQVGSCPWSLEGTLSSSWRPRTETGFPNLRLWELSKAVNQWVGNPYPVILLPWGWSGHPPRPSHSGPPGSSVLPPSNQGSPRLEAGQRRSFIYLFFLWENYPDLKNNF